MSKENYSVARVKTRTRDTVGKYERHNERKNEHYGNINVDLERTPMNVHFKSCGDLTYNEYLNKLIDEGKVSLRGLKKDAKIYDEMILDVNTDYFEKHGGYEFAKRFYSEAYRFAVKVYGEENILSAVMHADEVNLALSDFYGKPIYHYHMHIVALPVVEKQILWSKRCKDKALIGTVKEVIQQVSHSKKWKSPQAVNENGEPLFDKKGKPVLIPTYSILQDEFFEHMQNAGFTDFCRGERGSTAENKSCLQYQIDKDKERLKEIQSSIQSAAAEQEIIEDKHHTFNEIDSMGKSNLLGNKVTLSKEDYKDLTDMAKASYSAKSELKRTQEECSRLCQQCWSLQSRVSRLEQQLDELSEKCHPYLEVLKAAPQKVKQFIDGILEAVRQKKEENGERIFHQPQKSKKKEEHAL